MFGQKVTAICPELLRRARCRESVLRVEILPARKVQRGERSARDATTDLKIFA